MHEYSMKEQVQFSFDINLSVNKLYLSQIVSRDSSSLYQSIILTCQRQDLKV